MPDRIPEKQLIEESLSRCVSSSVFSACDTISAVNAMKTKSLSGLLLFSCLFLFTACGGGGGGGDSTPIVPGGPTHIVVGASLANNATGVSTSLAAIQITFAHEMDPASTTAAVQIMPALKGRYNVSGKVLTFSIEATLLSGTQYTVTVGTTATDTTGAALEQAYTLKFTTAGSGGGTAPGAVGDLTATGTSFGVFSLAFTAPNAGSDTTSAYLVRYATGEITSALFDSKTGVHDLPVGVVVPSPVSSGTQVSFAVNASLLTEASPGDILRFAMKSQTIGGDLSDLSNVIVTSVPWYLNLRFAPRDQAGIFRLLKLGSQDGATAAFDKDAPGNGTFDSEAPPPLPLDLRGIFTLAGRSEELLTDIRAPFTGATGQSQTWTIELSGTAAQPMKVEFPSFNTTTPLYTFRMGGIEAYEVILSGQTLDFTLDGSGNRTLTVTVIN